MMDLTRIAEKGVLTTSLNRRAYRQFSSEQLQYKAILRVEYRHHECLAASSARRCAADPTPPRSVRTLPTNKDLL